MKLWRSMKKLWKVLFLYSNLDYRLRPPAYIMRQSRALIQCFVCFDFFRLQESSRVGPFSGGSWAGNDGGCPHYSIIILLLSLSGYWYDYSNPCTDCMTLCVQYLPEKINEQREKLKAEMLGMLWQLYIIFTHILSPRVICIQAS